MDTRLPVRVVTAVRVAYVHATGEEEPQQRGERQGHTEMPEETLHVPTILGYQTGGYKAHAESLKSGVRRSDHPSRI